MNGVDDRRRRTHGRGEQPRRYGHPLLLLGAAALGFVVTSSYVRSRPAADTARDAATGQRSRIGGSMAAGVHPAASVDSVGQRHALLASVSPPAAQTAARPRQPAQRLAQLDRLLAHVKTMKAMTPERADRIERVLRELRDGGAAAVPAIGELLRRGDDVDFTAMRDGELLGHRTLRQAMIDTLIAIGGSEAMAVSLEQIEQTTEPLELVTLARSVEREEPGVHSEQVIHAIDDVLQRAEQAAPKTSPDVSPLFDVLRTYGGDDAVAILQRSIPHWGEYALIALAGLPSGEGIPSLTALATTSDAPIANLGLPFRMLAQATTQYVEAGDALVELARAGQISDDGWRAMGEALGGNQLRFSANMFDGTPLAENAPGMSRAKTPLRTYYVEWMNVRYEEDVVSTSWSADQVAQQLALIDDLLDVTSSPTAAQALQQARASLQREPST